jgi:hypothetical protein
MNDMSHSTTRNNGGITKIGRYSPIVWNLWNIKLPLRRSTETGKSSVTVKYLTGIKMLRKLRKLCDHINIMLRVKSNIRKINASSTSYFK